MKRIFTLSAALLIISIFVGSCVRDQYPNQNSSYWLSKERGQVVYSDSYCNYYVVETNNGYNIVRTYAGYKPYDGDIVYGNFSNTGTRDIYNQTTGYVFTGTVTDFWLSYNGAQDALNYYCPTGKGMRVFKTMTK